MAKATLLSFLVLSLASGIILTATGCGETFNGCEILPEPAEGSCAWWVEQLQAIGCTPGVCDASKSTPYQPPPEGRGSPPKPSGLIDGTQLPSDTKEGGGASRGGGGGGR